MIARVDCFGGVGTGSGSATYAHENTVLQALMAAALRAPFLLRAAPTNSWPSTVTPMRWMTFGVVPSLPSSKYCVCGRMMASSMDGCSCSWLAGSSRRSVGFVASCGKQMGLSIVAKQRQTDYSNSPPWERPAVRPGNRESRSPPPATR